VPVTSGVWYWSRLFIFQSSWRSSCGTRPPLCRHRDTEASRSRTPTTRLPPGTPPQLRALLSHPATYSDVHLGKYTLQTHCLYQGHTAGDTVSLNNLRIIKWLCWLCGIDPQLLMNAEFFISLVKNRALK
jgi:hypothetical protein